MSFIKAFEEELEHMLTIGESRDVIVRWVSNKVLDSYKNGVATGKSSKGYKNPKRASEIPAMPQA